LSALSPNHVDGQRLSVKSVIPFLGRAGQMRSSREF
jgi:hypothetical protein